VGGQATTKDRLPLVDGYLRVAAAQTRGDTIIDAELHEGSRHDALRYAVGLASSQRGIGQGAALARIKRHSEGRWQS
jgi:hypothetical protein